MRGRWRIEGIFVLVALLAVCGWYFAESRNQPQYMTARVESGDIRSSISATGTVNAKVTVQVGSQVSGNIKELYADFNTRVTKGQVVALIDPQLFQARVNQASASVESARAAVGNAQANVERGEADLATARANAANQKANVSRAKVALADAQLKLKRRVEMFDAKVLSREERDTAEYTYQSAQEELTAAQAQYDASQHAVKAAEAQRDVARTQLTSARAQVKQTEATLRQSQVDLDHTQIRAPVDGTVIARRMDVGQTVAASFQAPTIFEIAQDLAKMQVDTNVDEADIGRVRPGQPATFTVDAYPGTVFKASVNEIRKAPINTQNVITYVVVVNVDNRELKLFPGMTANVRIATEEAKNVLKVPNAALRFRPSATDAPPKPGGATVYRLEDGKPKAVDVKTGLTDGAFTAVGSADLTRGDLVITGVQGPAAAAPRSRQKGPGF
ncbi:MAG: efflux RND transporter periplasmic adaptor subunit [Phycisphaerales bacterium]|nr:efflux RND transporter periplasmic adaptor subunit [Phycisphaerales bacterium]